MIYRSRWLSDYFKTNSKEWFNGLFGISNEYVVRKSKCVFWIFWFQKIFLTFLVLMIPVWYINWSGFLATSKPIWRKGLMVYSAIQMNMQSENQNVFFEFSDFKKNFLALLVFEIPGWYIVWSGFLIAGDVWKH